MLKSKPNSSAMVEGGFYNRHSAVQAAGVALLSSLWESACQTVAIGDAPLTIVDYGSSQGRNSMVPVSTAIKVLRERAGSSVPIEVIHTDLPSNDFSALFQTLERDPSSYLVGTSGVFPAAIGRSFFEPLRPPRSIHLGWTTWALQWMSHTTADAPDHILAGMSRSPDVMAAVKLQQAADWQRFLEVRAAEMHAGGKLLAAFTGRTADETGWEWLLGELWSSVEDMGRDGLLSREEQHRLTIPIGLRTVEEVRAPFLRGVHITELILEHVEILRVPDPFWDDLQRTCDRQTFAQHHADVTRAWSGPTIASLIDPTRDRTKLEVELFTRFARRLAANPRRHEPYMVAALVTKLP